jgi:hypothetical protein
VPAALRRILLHRRAPPVLAALASLVLSAIAVLRSPLINNDGIWYLQAAETFVRSGFRAAQVYHPWPFYPALIAVTAATLRLSYESAAHVVSAALVALASAAFVGLARELGASRRVQWMAVAIILSHPSVNRFRPLLIRDFGLCAFALLAVTQLLRFGREPRALPALLWAAYSAAAISFRAESIVLAAVAPLCLLVDRQRAWSRRPATLLRLLGAPALLAAGVGFWLWTHEAAASSFRQGILYLQPLLGGFRAGADALAASFPLPHGREYAPYIVLVGLSAVPIAKLVKVTGLVHGALAILGWRTDGEGPSRFARRTMAIVTVASMVAACGFLLRYLFIETRYALLTSLLVCAWAPYGVERLWAGGTRVPAAAARPLLAAGLALTLAYGLASIHRRSPHVTDAVEWLIRNTPPDARLYTNDVQMAYYGGRRVDWENVTRACADGPYDLPAFRRNDYAAVLYPHTFGGQDIRLVLEQRLRFETLFTSTNGVNETIVIYRIPVEATPTGARASP